MQSACMHLPSASDMINDSAKCYQTCTCTCTEICIHSYELTRIFTALHRGSIRSSDLSSFWSFSTLDDNELHTFTITYTPKILLGIIFYNCCLHRQMSSVNSCNAYIQRIMYPTWCTKMSSLLSSLHVWNTIKDITKAL